MCNLYKITQHRNSTKQDSHLLSRAFGYLFHCVHRLLNSIVIDLIVFVFDRYCSTENGCHWFSSSIAYGTNTHLCNLLCKTFDKCNVITFIVKIYDQCIHLKKAGVWCFRIIQHTVMLSHETYALYLHFSDIHDHLGCFFAD